MMAKPIRALELLIIIFCFHSDLQFRSVVSVYIDDMAFELFQILNLYKVMKS